MDEAFRDIERGLSIFSLYKFSKNRQAKTHQNLYMLIQGFNISHFEDSGFLRGVCAVRTSVFGNDHFGCFHHIVNALLAVPISRTRFAVLNGEKRVLFDGDFIVFLLAERVVNLMPFRET